jgi:predicted dehydrogenase
VKDGRLGVVRGIRDGAHDYGAVAFGGKKVQALPAGASGLYKPLVAEIVKFFQTGAPPVPNAETLEIMAFIEAAERSRQRGVAVKLADIE